ncbi:hypothetical protein AGMMS49579_13560 [Spirochaetia bacterium]|nr:hypothetical protein AGMMS49579_13560 [Spirochaetia bacterium]
MTDLSSFNDLEISEACSKITEFADIYETINAALKLSLSMGFITLLFARNMAEIVKNMIVPFGVLLKEDEQYTEYQQQDSFYPRPAANDRVFPLETVEIQRFRTKTDADIEDVIIHTGPYADEYTRSYNALAITIANEIFFRNNAFDPSSEEGGKTLVHELTHVAQYKEGRITSNDTIETLEEEAESVESRTAYDDDPYCVFQVRDKLCRIRKSEMKAFISKTADAIESGIGQQKHILSEGDYLKLLAEYEAWLKGGASNGFFRI